MTNQASKVSGNVSVPRELAVLVMRSLNGGSDQLTGMEHGKAFRELRAILAKPAAPIEQPTWESLARRLAYYLPNTLVTHQQYMTPETMHDALEALDQVRKMSATPIEQPREIPVAAGEVEVLAWVLTDGNEEPVDSTLRWDVAKHWPEYARPLVDRAHVTRLQAEVVGYKMANSVLRDELKAERLRADVAAKDANDAESDLTKAREFLAQAANRLSDLGQSHLSEPIFAFLNGNQSAPVAKGECEDCFAVQEAEQNPNTQCDSCGWAAAKGESYDR